LPPNDDTKNISNLIPKYQDSHYWEGVSDDESDDDSDDNSDDEMPTRMPALLLREQVIQQRQPEQTNIENHSVPDSDDKIPTRVSAPAGWRAAGNNNATAQTTIQPVDQEQIDSLTTEELRSIGLKLAGFGIDRQGVSERTNNERFSASYGVSSKFLNDTIYHVHIRAS
jgi:hypothetical protein